MSIKRGFLCAFFAVIGFKAHGLNLDKLKPLPYSQISGWEGDNHELARNAFLKSCIKLLTQQPDDGFRKALYDICLEAPSPLPAKVFFETKFTPYLVSQDGFVTAYYEPEIVGSRVKSEIYKYPLYKRPLDLVSESGVAFDARKKAGFKRGGRLEPYHTRGEIENGALSSQNLEIVYLKDENDGFFLSIQGSGRVKLVEGGVARLGYDAHNGHSYTPIGRVLVERKIADKAIVTMDYLRGYLAENMDRAKELRAQNKSYVFFRELTELRESEGPIGAQGIPVTAWRTLAVDKSLYTYGTPIFVDANLPLQDLQAGAPFSQLMIAQDTGSAIRGIARGDLYLGSGFEAGFMAGNIKHKVSWIALIPNKLVKP